MLTKPASVARTTRGSAYSICCGKPAVTALLNSVSVPVDTLLYNTLAALGVGIGQADIRVTGASCGRAVLVQ